MPTFDTPQPIRARIQLRAGGIRLTASTTDQTVVTLTPTRPERAADREAVERARVTFADGVLDVVAARERGLAALRSSGSIELHVELPTDSDVDAETAYGDVETAGCLGSVTLKTAAGNLRVDEATQARVRTSSGNADARRVSTQADLSTSAGNVSLVENLGQATLRTSYGDIVVGASSGPLEARTAYGQLRIDSVSEGDLRLHTGYGAIDVGVLDGTAAQLELVSDHGHVRSDLEPSEGPPQGDNPVVTITAATKYGSVTIRKARP